MMAAACYVSVSGIDNRVTAVTFALKSAAEGRLHRPEASAWQKVERTKSLSIFANITCERRTKMEQAGVSF